MLLSESEVRGQKADPADSLQLYQKAAKKNLARAQCNLGFCCLNGIGTAKDAEQAVYWFQKAAEQDHGRAQYLLAQCYEDGSGVVQDFQQAKEWYEKSLAQGFQEAEKALAALEKKAKKKGFFRNSSGESSTGRSIFRFFCMILRKLFG